MAKPIINAQHLRELFHYDPLTGAFTRLVRRGKFQPGTVAGTVNDDGRHIISIYGRLYRAHRLAWLYMKGEWPKDQIDHKNCVPLDNSFDNLREATNALNHQNERSARKGNSSGFLGVSWDASRNKWKAQITTNGKNRLLGRFDTREEAAGAYAAAKRVEHPFCTI